MVTFKSAFYLIEKDCYFTYVDLKDAYFPVPIRLNDRKYLKG